MDDEIYLPPMIREMVDRLTRDTDVEPTLTRHVNGILLQHSSEHVYLTVRYRLTRKGWGWANSTLTIDGKKQTLLAHDYDDYVQIFKLGHRRGLEDFAQVVELPSFPLADEKDAPLAVLRELAQHRQNAIQTGASKDAVVLRRDGDRYVIHISYAPFQFWFWFLQIAGEWRLREPDEHAVIAAMEREGVHYDVGDKLAELGGDVLKLMEILGHEVPETPSSSPISHHSAPKRLNSVEVRRSTVIRV